MSEIYLLAKKELNLISSKTICSVSGTQFKNLNNQLSVV